MLDNSPKVFISYSWSSEGYRDLVRSYAERLVGDGVDVVLDQWDLSEGQDVYVFMEKAVADSSLTHVLIFSDRMYKDKADARVMGVGVESQIISKEIYEKTDQKKFLPIICEKTSDGEPCLPVFLQSRVWIDFSTPEAANENWDKLLRAIYGKPLFEKPQLGKPPSYFEEDKTRAALPTIGQWQTLMDALRNSKPTLPLCRQEFVAGVVDFADRLRLREDPGGADKLEERVLGDLHTMLPLRDQIVNWLVAESIITDSVSLEPVLIDLLERLLSLKYRPPEVTRWNGEWFDAHGIFVSEMFLYIIAVLIKFDRPELISALFKSQYLLPESEAINNNDFVAFTEFRGYSRILINRNQRLESRRLDPLADLIQERATINEFPFHDLMQADLLAFLVSMLSQEHPWYPGTMVFAGRSGIRFSLFVRAARHQDFKRLQTITGVASADDLRAKFTEGYEKHGVERWSDLRFWSDVSFRNAMRLDALDTIL